MDTQLVVFSYFDFRNNKFWAFKQMRTALRELADVEGLTFFKILGTGSNNGFSSWPDFSTYSMLSVWESAADYHRFRTAHPFFMQYSKRSTSEHGFTLLPVHGHGTWDGKQPFNYSSAEVHEDTPWAIITRATVRPSKLLRFWKHVPSVSRSITQNPYAQLAMGIGEWPLIQQATFSIWDSIEKMKKFAYQSDLHRNVVAKTRSEHWYSEEMFIRFRVLDRFTR